MLSLGAEMHGGAPMSKCHADVCRPARACSRNAFVLKAPINDLEL